MKAQISQVFVYIISAIVIVAVLGFGVKSIFKLNHDVNDVKCLQFKKDFEKKIYEDKAYGTVDITRLKVGCGFKEVCFATDRNSDSNSLDNNNPSSINYLSSYDPIIGNSWDDKAKQNLFFKNTITEEFYYVPDLLVEDGVQCFSVDHSGIPLKLRGLGDATLLEKQEDIPQQTFSNQ